MALTLSGHEKQSTKSAAPDASALVSSEGPAAAGEVSKRLAGVFKLLADETRLRILLLLFEREELNVRTLCDLLDQSQPAVSHHLALLRTDGLIECRREGKNNFYHILPQRLEQLVNMVFHVFPGGASVTKIEPRDTGIDQADG